MKKEQIIAIVICILGIVLFFTPSFIAPTCAPMEDGKFMKCHWMGEAIKAMGGIIAVLGLISIFACNAGVRMGLAIGIILSGIASVLMPTKLLIGVCKSPTMRCVSTTRPAIFVIVAIIIILGIVQLLFSKKEIKCS
ncbi:MAG: DUF4418 family protein [Ezakiella sp.]|nr:DUF4418 family protein [Ezakiella sp.]